MSRKSEPQRRSLLRQGYGAPGRTQRKKFIVVKTNTKPVARRAGVFIDSEFSSRINKINPLRSSRLERAKRKGG